MGYDRDAPKRTVNVSLSEDLVRAATHYTTSLDETLEALLQQFVMREQARRFGDKAALNRFLNVWNDFHAQHGLPSDDVCDP